MPETAATSRSKESSCLDARLPDHIARNAPEYLERLRIATRRDDGAIGPDRVAELTVEAVRAGTFLVLPHPVVLDMYRGKGADYDRWLAGMRR